MIVFFLCKNLRRKTSASFPLRQVRGHPFTLLPLADAAEADAVHPIAFGIFHLPTNAMQATTTPSTASIPTVSVQLLRKCFAQLSIRTCRHGGGEHVVLAATAVCMCLQILEGLRSFFDIIAITYEKGAKSSLYRALPDITSNRRYIGSPPCQ